MNREKREQQLISLYESKYGCHPQIEKIEGGGSSREYYRLMGEAGSIIGVFSQDLEENKTFIKVGRLLKENGVNVPEIIFCDSTEEIYFQEDLGNQILLPLLKEENKIQYAQRALEGLAKFQNLNEEEWKDVVGFPPFSKRLVRWDLNYFKYDFLKPYGVEFDENLLEDDFDRLTEDTESENMEEGLMFRDFQSRNLMLKNDTIYMIDFQGARKGPIAYDAVSFIWQAKAPFNFEEREALGEYYAKISGKYQRSYKKIKSDMEKMQVLRILQVLGAYGFRGLIERKPHFIESIPFAVKNLYYLKQKGRLAKYPEIERIAERLYKTLESRKCIQNINFEKDKEQENVLTVDVISFSYKKGYPEGKGGNGGGFIFDCRGMHNPGRYEDYREKTGLDEEVVIFLKNRGEADQFLEQSFNLVKPTVERYINRNFTSLQVGFGCTGGQHRSVYCAQKFGEKLKKEFPDINVVIVHREQKIDNTL